MAVIFRPEDKSELEKLKINKEIDKLELEAKELKKTRYRFWLTLLSPLFIAGLGTLVVVKSRYFDAVKIETENAKTKFTADTTAYSHQKDSIVRRLDSLNSIIDSKNKTIESLNSIVHTITRSFGDADAVLLNKISELKSENNLLQNQLIKSRGENLMSPSARKELNDSIAAAIQDVRQQLGGQLHECKDDFTLVGSENNRLKNDTANLKKEILGLEAEIEKLKKK